jgi:hypothetical protein
MNVRHLTKLELEELCDLFAKCGEGDLLDFIHWIQRSAKRNNWTESLVKEICQRMPMADSVICSET